MAFSLFGGSKVGRRRRPLKVRSRRVKVGGKNVRGGLRKSLKQRPGVKHNLKRRRSVRVRRRRW